MFSNYTRTIKVQKDYSEIPICRNELVVDHGSKLERASLPLDLAEASFPSQVVMCPPSLDPSVFRLPLRAAACPAVLLPGFCALLELYIGHGTQITFQPLS